MQVVLQLEDCYMFMCSKGINDVDFMSNMEFMALVHVRA